MELCSGVPNLLRWFVFWVLITLAKLLEVSASLWTDISKQLNHYFWRNVGSCVDVHEDVVSPRGVVNSRSVKISCYFFVLEFIRINIPKFLQCPFKELLLASYVVIHIHVAVSEWTEEDDWRSFVLIKWTFVFILNFLQVLVPLGREKSQLFRWYFRTVNLFQGLDASWAFMESFVAYYSSKCYLINANLRHLILKHVHLHLRRWKL